MRICVAVGRYPVVTETFVYESVETLRALGHDVRLVADRRGWRPDGPPVGPEPRFVGGLSTFRSRVLPLVARPFPAIRTLAALRRQVGMRWTTVWDAPSLAALDEVASADCLLAHFGYVGARWLPAAALARRPLAVYFHGSDATRWIQRAPRMYDALFASDATLLTNSEFLQRRLIDAGADGARVRVVPLAAHEAFSASPDPPPLTAPRMVTVARLVPKKGVDDAIRGFAAACPRLPKAWRYDIIGDGPERRRLRALARELGVADRVRFTRAASRAQILELLTESSVFVLASRTASNGDTEGTPIALIEAATLGVASIGTMHAGIPEILPHQAPSLGYAVPERDTHALASAIVRLASDETERRRWGLACLKRARCRTKQREVQETIGALDLAVRYPRWPSRVH
jgi:colanic acid/amylovoran biosynthesis glycosyltransferase